MKFIFAIHFWIVLKLKQGREYAYWACRLHYRIKLTSLYLAWIEWRGRWMGSQASIHSNSHSFILLKVRCIVFVDKTIPSRETIKYRINSFKRSRNFNQLGQRLSRKVAQSAKKWKILKKIFFLLSSIIIYL